MLNKPGGPAGVVEVVEQVAERLPGAAGGLVALTQRDRLGAVCAKGAGLGDVVVGWRVRAPRSGPEVVLAVVRAGCCKVVEHVGR